MRGLLICQLLVLLLSIVSLSVLIESLHAFYVANICSFVVSRTKLCFLITALLISIRLPIIVVNCLRRRSFTTLPRHFATSHERALIVILGSPESRCMLPSAEKTVIDSSGPFLGTLIFIVSLMKGIITFWVALFPVTGITISRLAISLTDSLHSESASELLVFS